MIGSDPVLPSDPGYTADAGVPAADLLGKVATSISFQSLHRSEPRCDLVPISQILRPRWRARPTICRNYTRWMQTRLIRYSGATQRGLYPAVYDTWSLLTNMTGSTRFTRR